MLVLALAGGWLAFGALAVALMRRRGHDVFAWSLVFLFFGPLALPVAISADRHRPAEPPRPLPPGGLDVLVFDDGSRDAQAALQTALGLLGSHATSITLAAVLDLEAPSTVRGHDAQRAAQERLDRVALEVAAATAAPVATVVLFGKPETALQHYAVENGYEVIVEGRAFAHNGGRRHGNADRSVPVLIGPGRT